MQSEGYSFCGDVVLDSVSMVIRDEDSNIRKANIFGLLFWRINIFSMIEEDAHLKKYSTLQQGAHNATEVLICFFL